MAAVDYDAWDALTVKRAVCQLGSVSLKINIIFTSISERLAERVYYVSLVLFVQNNNITHVPWKAQSRP